jgi:hypothetical protein
MADEESNQSVEGPASVARLIIEAQHDLSPEQAEYMAKMEAYFGEPGHDQ